MKGIPCAAHVHRRPAFSKSIHFCSSEASTSPLHTSLKGWGVRGQVRSKVPPIALDPKHLHCRPLASTCAGVWGLGTWGVCKCLGARDMRSVQVLGG